MVIDRSGQLFFKATVLIYVAYRRFLRVLIKILSPAFCVTLSETIKVE